MDAELTSLVTSNPNVVVELRQVFRQRVGVSKHASKQSRFVTRNLGNFLLDWYVKLRRMFRFHKGFVPVVGVVS